MTRPPAAQGLLLTTYLKLLIADPEDANLRSLAEEVFERYSRYPFKRISTSVIKHVALART
jgi:hypothetical protein